MAKTEIKIVWGKPLTHEEVMDIVRGVPSNFIEAWYDHPELVKGLRYIGETHDRRFYVGFPAHEIDVSGHTGMEEMHRDPTPMGHYGNLSIYNYIRMNTEELLRLFINDLVHDRIEVVNAFRSEGDEYGALIAEAAHNRLICHVQLSHSHFGWYSVVSVKEE